MLSGVSSPDTCTSVTGFLSDSDSGTMFYQTKSTQMLSSQPEFL